MSKKIRNRHRLKSKQIRSLDEIITDVYGNEISIEKYSIEVGEFEDIRIVFIDDFPCFFYQDNNIFITLKGIERLGLKKKYVIIDMGAVKFIANGADVMSPGITDADPGIKKGDIVWIGDERHHKPLAVGFALSDGKEMIENNQGKSVNIIHFVGDKIWSLKN